MNVDSSGLLYRKAVPEDAEECVIMRGKTRQNPASVEYLRSLGITTESWSDDIASGEVPGFVCISDGRIIGYCFGASGTGEVRVLAILPEFEEKGIGRELLRLVVEDLQTYGHRRLFLGCSPDPESRSHGFYRHLGWVSTGTYDSHGDEILELFP